MENVQENKCAAGIPLLMMMTQLGPVVIMKMMASSVFQLTSVMGMVILSQMGDLNSRSDKMLLTLWDILGNVQDSRFAAGIPLLKGIISLMTFLIPNHLNKSLGHVEILKIRVSNVYHKTCVMKMVR